MKARARGAGKRVLLVASPIPIAAGLAIVNNDGGSDDAALAVVFVLAVYGVLVPFSMWQTRRLLSGYELHVGEDGLMRRQRGSDVHIGWDEVGQVAQHRDGSLVVTSADQKRVIGVFPELERFQEIGSEIARRAPKKS